MFATGLKDYLVSEDVGVFNTDLFVSKFPDAPDDAICIFDEAGPVLVEMSSYDANNFGTEIMVRGSYSYCKGRILTILRKVPMLAGTYNDMQVIDTRIQSFPQFIEVDKKGRRLYSIHFTHYTNIGNNKYRTETFTP